MPAKFRTAIGQIDAVRGELDVNLQRMTDKVREAEAAGVDLLVFPELALTGYLIDSAFSDAAIKLDSDTMNQIRDLSANLDIAFGFIEETEASLFYNSVAYVSRGEIVHVHRKIYLPTYGMFDERRYFGAGWDIRAFDTRFGRVGMLICGDAWHMPLAYLLAHDGADMLLIVAASSREGLANTTPCNEAWNWVCRTYALSLSCFVAFANFAGADGRLHFWGGSFVSDPAGMLLNESRTDQPDLVAADVDMAELRKQRIKLPFRRDDSLAHTLQLGQHILQSKHERERFNGEMWGDAMIAKPR